MTNDLQSKKSILEFLPGGFEGNGLLENLFDEVAGTSKIKDGTIGTIEIRDNSDNFRDKQRKFVCLWMI